VGGRYGSALFRVQHLVHQTAAADLVHSSLQPFVSSPQKKNIYFD
jgi:hypothetical protein